MSDLANFGTNFHCAFLQLFPKKLYLCKWSCRQTWQDVFSVTVSSANFHPKPLAQGIPPRPRFVEKRYKTRTKKMVSKV